MFNQLFNVNLNSICLSRNANQAIAAATWTTVQYDTIQYNDGFEWDTATFEVVLNHSGIYNFSVVCGCDNVATTGYGIALILNGAFNKIDLLAVNGVAYHGVSFTYYLVGGSRIKVQFYNNIACNLTNAILPNNTLTITRF